MLGCQNTRLFRLTDYCGKRFFCLHTAYVYSAWANDRAVRPPSRLAQTAIYNELKFGNHTAHNRKSWCHVAYTLIFIVTNIQEVYSSGNIF